MAVVVDPADRAVLADDPVFHVVHVSTCSSSTCLLNGMRYLLVILRMNHAAEGKAGQSLEVLQAVAAEDIADGLVGVQQLLVLVRLVDEEAAGHVLAELLDHRKALIVKDKLLAEHRIPCSFRCNSIQYIQFNTR